MNLTEIKLFYWFNSFVFQNGWLDAFIFFRARYLGYLVCVALILFVAATFLKKYERFRARASEAARAAFVSAIAARWIVKPFITLFYERARPYEVLPMVKNLFIDATPAFPSGHALFFFALATGIYFYYPRTSILFFGAAFSISITRVVAGVHWPTDILAGAILGIMTALIVKKMFEHIKNTHSTHM